MQIVTALGNALWASFTMLWQRFWGPSLDFRFSAVIEVAVSRSEMWELLPDASPGSITSQACLVQRHPPALMRRSPWHGRLFARANVTHVLCEIWRLESCYPPSLN
jgi:hypothetical protein